MVKRPTDPGPHDNRMDHGGGFENGETRRELASRIYGAVDEILARPCKTLVIVTHGFALTFVVAAWIKRPLESVGCVRAALLTSRRANSG